jgi:DNA-binding NarL/FixJ family response regulator
MPGHDARGALPLSGCRYRPDPRPCCKTDRREEPREILTPRELEVLKLTAEAHTSKDIAELLVISLKTVERHRANILDKLGMRDRVELTRYAIRRGLVDA